MITKLTRRLVRPAVIAALLITGCDSGSSSGPATATTAGPTGSAGTPTNTVSAQFAPEKPVVAETLPYAEVDEQLVYGHFAFPADMVDPLPGVIVIHERWGLDDSARLLADRIAGQGFVVLAIDLYGGDTADDATTARALMVEVIENPELANENIRQAYQFLEGSAQAPRIASLGWSFGGGWALNSAMLLPGELTAAVIYYGQVTDNQARLTPVTTPILGLFGENDRGVSVASVREFEAALETLGKEHEIVVYSGVGHAFADPSASNYNHEVAEEAWQKTVSFLDSHLNPRN